MNRIRKVNDKYQVLINENYYTNPAIELTLGSLLAKEYLRDYTVKEFNTMQEAMNLAFNLPAIDFNKIRSDCVDCFKILGREIFNSLNGIVMIYKPYLLSADEIKNVIFDRVINNGNRFTFYNFNDVVAFDVIVNYKVEVAKALELLLMNNKLRIIRKTQTQTHVKLIGLTENNITYEIRLWTHPVRDFMYWIYKNNKNPLDYQEDINELIRRENENFFI